MAYGIYLALDQDRYFRNNFSSTNPLTGTIYTDINQTTVKDLTGYSIFIRMSRPNGPGRFSDFLNKEAIAVVEANGTWSLALSTGQVPHRGVYYVTAEISNTSDIESTLNRVEFYILEGPDGSGSQGGLLTESGEQLLIE
jgi:hypothetical protein